MRLALPCLFASFLMISMVSCTDQNTLIPAEVSLETEDTLSPPSNGVALDGGFPVLLHDTTPEDINEDSTSDSNSGDPGANEDILADIEEQEDPLDIESDSVQSASIEISNPSVVETAEWGLGATVTFNTNSAATPSLSIISEGNTRVLPSEAILSGGNSTNHQILVLGLRADTEYSFRLQATTSEGGFSEDVLVNWVTASLPEDIFSLTFEPSSGFVSGETGYITLAAANVTNGIPATEKTGYLIVLDREGEVVGYKKWPIQQVYARMAPGGGWYSLRGKLELSQWNREGQLVDSWLAADAGTDTFHHEILPIEDGSVAVLGSTLKTLDGYPDGTHDVIGDLLLEVNLEAKAITEVLNLFDVLDPFRITSAWATNFWTSTYKDVSDAPKDWTHGNSLYLTPDGLSYIASLRNQNAVAQFSRSTGELEWILGEEALSSETDDEWPWLELPAGTRVPNQQHSATLTESGTLMLYDNGNDISVSSASEYALNLEDGSASLAWSWTDTEHPSGPIHSRNGGNAEPAPGGRVLLTHSQLPTNEADDNSSSYALIQMVRKSDEGTVKEWDLSVKMDDPNASARVYRAHFVPSLYSFSAE